MLILSDLKSHKTMPLCLIQNARAFLLKRFGV